jgi:hypothetical protein
MTLTSTPRSWSRPRRGIACLTAVAILLAGITQAAHFHKDELSGGPPDVHCLLCMYAAVSAGPPTVAQPVLPTTGYCTDILAFTRVSPPSHHPVAYEARGPPLS